ncbi:RQC domain protein [Peptococcaceae bacterium CEB3]|nr:RQC domain protein [Peptococcaceae bacterium CEB3]
MIANELKLRTILSTILEKDLYDEKIYSFRLSVKGKPVLCNKAAGKSYGISGIISRINQIVNIEDTSAEAILSVLPNKLSKNITEQLKPYLSNVAAFEKDIIVTIFDQKHQEIHHGLALFNDHNKAMLAILRAGIKNNSLTRLFDKEARKIVNANIKKSCDHSDYDLSVDNKNIKVKCPDCEFHCLFDGNTLFKTDTSILNQMEALEEVILGYTDFGKIEESFRRFNNAFFQIKSESLLELSTLRGRYGSFRAKSMDELIRNFEKDAYQYDYKIKTLEFANLRFDINDEAIADSLKKGIRQLIALHETQLIRLKAETDALLAKEPIRIVLMAIKAIPKYGKTTYADLLKGAKNKKMAEYELDKSEYYGLLSGYKRHEIESMIDSLEANDMLRTYYSQGDRHNRYPKLRLTEQASGVFTQKIALPIQPVITQDVPDDFKTLLNELYRFPKEVKAKAIKTAIEKGIIHDADFPFIFEYTLEKRAYYRDVLDEFF